MPTTFHIALLRGINVAGHRPVAMADLRAMTEGLGFEQVRTLLASGNLVFESSRTGPALEKLLETTARKKLGLDTEFITRTGAEIKAVIAANPFPKEAERDPGHLVVMFCKQPVAKTLKITGARREVVRPKGREIYIVYPDGQGTSKLRLDVRGTARNWNTVLKLGALTQE